MKNLSSRLAAAFLLSAQLFASGCRGAEDVRHVCFTDANTRDNYQTVHRVKEAHQLATGKGVRVGIIDKYFGYKKHPEIYTGGIDLVGDRERFENVEEHGLWMAATLKEMAPGVKIYAINVRSNDREAEARAFAKAVDWAIENNIDVLTYSAEAIKSEFRPIVDQAIEKAVGRGVTTVFINVDHPLNILPYTFFSAEREKYGRMPDIRVYPYDYNLLLLQSYRKYLEADRKPRSGDALPYFSLSSTAVVLAAGVAMLKEVDPRLTPGECRRIIVESAKTYTYAGRQVTGVLDYPHAIELAQKR